MGLELNFMFYLLISLYTVIECVTIMEDLECPEVLILIQSSCIHTTNTVWIHIDCLYTNCWRSELDY